MCLCFQFLFSVFSFLFFLCVFFFFVFSVLIKFRLVVDNVTTVHGVHTNTVAFSPSVLIKCGICSCHQTRTPRMNGSRKRSTAYDTESYDLIIFPFFQFSIFSIGIRFLFSFFFFFCSFCFLSFFAFSVLFWQFFRVFDHFS